MKKSKKNYKKIVVIALAILLAAAGTIYSVNTKQLTGFTRINVDRINLPDKQPVELNLATQDYEASKDSFNKQNENGACKSQDWKKSGRFVLNINQSDESISTIKNNFKNIGRVGCDIKIAITNLTERFSNDLNKTPIKGNTVQIFHCISSKIESSKNFFECRTINRDGTETLEFSVKDLFSLTTYSETTPKSIQLKQGYINENDNYVFKNNSYFDNELMVEIFTK